MNVLDLECSALGFLVKLAFALPRHASPRTYEEIGELTGISRNTAQRHVQALEAAGLLDVRRRRINRKRYATNQYLIPPAAALFLGDLFSQIVGNVAQYPGNVAQILGGDSVNAFNVVVDVVQEEENYPLEKSLEVTPEPAQSLNGDGTELPVDPASWALLQHIGVQDNQTARQIAAYPPEQVKAAIAYARPKAKTNFAGYVLDTLRYGWLIPSPAPVPAPAVAKIQEEESTILPAGSTWYTPLPEETPTEPEYYPVETTTEQDVTHVTPEETPESRAWRSAYNQLELQFDRATFDTWLRESMFLRYADNTFFIGVPFARAVDQCQHILYRNIQRVLSDIYCRGSKANIIFEEHALPRRVVPQEEPLFKRLAREQQ